MNFIINHVIFLDIDGVLNAPGDKDIIKGIFSKSKLKLYSKLVSYYKLFTIVISSRKDNPKDREIIDKVFSKYNIKHTYISTHSTGLERALEIMEYLSNRLVSKFIIVDDNPYEYKNYSLTKKNFIEVGIEGFSKKYCIELLKHLGEI